MLDTYPIDHQTFLDRWQPIADTLNEFTPRPVPTKMVELDRSVRIPGHAGPQFGAVNDMLATDGAKFWTVQKDVLLDTYTGADSGSRERIKVMMNYRLLNRIAARRT